MTDTAPTRLGAVYVTTLKQVRDGRLDLSSELRAETLPELVAWSLVTERSCGYDLTAAGAARLKG